MPSSSSSSSSGDEEEIFSNALSPPPPPLSTSSFSLAPISSLDPIALLMDELKHENSAIRTNAIAHLPAIAEQLGPERTLSELIPFLEATEEEEDEVLLQMAIQIPQLASGLPQVDALLGPLERLLGEEDSPVREASLRAFRILLPRFSSQAVEEKVFPLIQAWSVHDWFPRKQSAAALAACTWSHLMMTSEREEKEIFSSLPMKILNCLLVLTRDPLPMVRRVAVKHLAEREFLGAFPCALLIGNVGSGNEVPSLLDALFEIANDSVDTVKLHLPAILVSLAETHFVERRCSCIYRAIGLLEKILCLEEEDGDWETLSWRIKYVLAENYADLWAYFGTEEEGDKKGVDIDHNNGKERNSYHSIEKESNSDHANGKGTFSFQNDNLNHQCNGQKGNNDQLCTSKDTSHYQFNISTLLNHKAYVSFFSQLLEDPEPEVRYSATLKLDAVLEKLLKETPSNCSLDLLKSLLQTSFPHLAQDSSLQVRLAFAKTFPHCLSMLPKQIVASEGLLDLYLSMLQAPQSTAEIRLAMVSQLPLLTEAFGGPEQLIQAILPALATLSRDSGWRVRKALVELFPLMASHFGIPFFDSYLSPLLSSLLADHYAAVREASLCTLTELVGIFGHSWGLELLIGTAIAGAREGTCLHGLIGSENFLFRQTALQAIERLMPLVSSSMNGGPGEGRKILNSSNPPPLPRKTEFLLEAQEFGQKLLGLVIEQLQDRVPNVRLVAWGCLGQVCKALNEGEGEGGFEASREHLIELLERESDEDVRSFAVKALAVAGGEA